ARARVASEERQDEGMGLARACDTDQALRGGGQQQRADGTLDRAVGDVEETGGVRDVHQALVQPPAHGFVDGGERSEQIALVHHRDSPFGNVFRKVAMPSAAALLAASSLPPTISATCR